MLRGEQSRYLSITLLGMKILLMLLLGLTQAFAQTEAPPRKLQDRPIEKRTSQGVEVTCPEIIRLSVEVEKDWVSNPCVGKFDGISPGPKGGAVGRVQCYYKHACGEDRFTIQKAYEGHRCRWNDKPREAVCTLGQ